MNTELAADKEIDLLSEAAPITIDPDGIARVGNTRVTLDTVVAAFLDGATSEEISQQYPTLSYADICLVVGNYLCHRAEDATYKQNKSRHPPQGVRERLIARGARA